MKLNPICQGRDREVPKRCFVFKSFPPKRYTYLIYMKRSHYFQLCIKKFWLGNNVDPHKFGHVKHIER